MSAFVPVVGSFPPRFTDVPDSAKWPKGPYKQAPTEYGGEWWVINLGPFGGSRAPWLDHVEPVAPPTYPDGFVETFGPRPLAEDYPKNYREVVTRWEQDLKYFKQAGLPEWISSEEFAAARDLFWSWGMGEPRPYEGRYGWWVRFPESLLPFFEADARSALQLWTHGIVAQYQSELAAQGIRPEQWHPFVPPIVRGEN